MKTSQKDASSLTLEDAILNRNIMLRFIDFLDKHFALDNLTFWLETQNFKYLRDQSQITTESLQIYEKYFGVNGCDINVDEKALKLDLAEKIRRPQRTIFLLLQNAMWGLIKLDCFPRFKESSHTYDKKFSTKELRALDARCGYTIRLLDIFHENNRKMPLPGGKFKSSLLPNDHYNQHLHLFLPEITEVWKDFDLFMAFREFLYQQAAPESLSFYLEALHYESLPSDLLQTTAQSIIAKYVHPVDINSIYAIDFDQRTLSALEQDMKNPTRETFVKAKLRAQMTLVNELFPAFIVSPLYHQCNTETIVYTATKCKQRSRTVLLYEELFVNSTVNKEPDSNKNSSAPQKNSSTTQKASPSNPKDDKKKREKADKTNKA